MIGFAVFLICLIIVVVLLKVLFEQFGGTLTPQIRLIIGLLLLLVVILWLFGGGGWHTIYGWHP